MKYLLYLFLLFAFDSFIQSQIITQSIVGKVVDKETQMPLPGSVAVILNSSPTQAAVTDTNGTFLLKKVPLGRCNIKISFIGYEPIIINEILVTSGKEIVLNVELKEIIKSINDVVIKANKSQPINSMATLSARQFSVEEARRFAGGFDDPARLATSFAGVSGNLSSNGIIIRGNSPAGLLWRMEGVEISNPSHFANVSSLGSGAITALSSQMLSNSDFYTGAFPSEYGNALSGVFDIKLRTGNIDHNENTFQVGIIGLDGSSEGPFIKGKQASYLFNYRFSTLTLLAPILPPEMGKLRYQDLSFKLNFPTQKCGTFSLWGIGALDYQGSDAKNDSLLWETDSDRKQYHSNLFMFAIGLNHKIITSRKSFINTSLAMTANGIALDEKYLNSSMALLPTDYIRNRNQNLTLTSYINQKFNARHTNKTGIIIERMMYNISILNADNDYVMKTYAKTEGNSYLIQAFTQSKYNITEKLVLNAGVHSQFFALNHHYSIEPRTGINWNITPTQSFGIAYGLHSQIQPLNLYFTHLNSGSGRNEPDKQLDFSKAQHVVLSYEIKINESTHLKIEPYIQKLYNIPVIPNTYYSLQNIENTIYFKDSFVNKGTGKNIGIDFTLERFLNKGYYYLITASLFNSNYRGGDGIERNARFNKKYVFNFLYGKEWQVGKSKNNFLSINGKLCLMGGDFMNPVDSSSSYASKELVENVSQAFTKQKPRASILSLSVTYRINKAGYASVWALNFINVLFYKELNNYYYDKTTNSIRKDENELVIPNISYKLEF